MDGQTTTPAKDLFDQLHDLVINYDTSLLDNDQESFILYMDLTRILSWDIPSAMPCDHLDDLHIDDFPMHRPAFYTSDWDIIDRHFTTVHGLDLNNPRINWSFDT